MTERATVVTVTVDGYEYPVCPTCDERVWQTLLEWVNGDPLQTVAAQCAAHPQSATAR